jgi:hypothetical protein
MEPDSVWAGGRLLQRWKIWLEWHPISTISINLRAAAHLWVSIIGYRRQMLTGYW